MRRFRDQPRQSFLSRTGGPIRIPPIAALILCLILAASLLQACALAPIVMVAATSTAGLLVEAEKAITKGDTADVLAVDQDAVVYEGPGAEYSQVTRLNKGVEVKILRKHGDWIECKSGRFEEGWIHISSVKDI
ncbi:MAG: SH3 domain-containing protein [Thermodesulfobacteriota bacterium]